MNAESIFHEFYGVYYKAVERLINVAQTKAISVTDAEDIVRQTAYAESPWILTRNIQRNQYSPVIDGRFRTPLGHSVEMPMTTLEKRWIKAILSDERVKLFGIETTAFDDIEPLFGEDDIYYCGQYAGGDDYSSEEYISKFRTILMALRERYSLPIEYVSAHKHFYEGIVEPIELQYSIKENRFRLFAVFYEELRSFNLSRINACGIGSKICGGKPVPKFEQTYVEVSIANDRHTLERFLLTFSNYQRSTKKINEDLFKVRVTFPKQDAKEVLVNILSFTPMAKIIAPAHMLELYQDKIERQRAIEATKEFRK